MQTYDSHPTWYTLGYMLVYPRAALSLLAVCHIRSSCSADKAAWLQYVSSDVKLMKEIRGFFVAAVNHNGKQDYTEVFLTVFFSCGPASFLCPRNKDLRYELLNGWKDPFSFFVQAIYNRCQQKYWKNFWYGHAFLWLGACMQESLNNYNSKSWYLNTILGANYKLKLNGTTLFIRLLILRAALKCCSKDLEKNAKKNTVCKWVVGRCKGHVYPSCYEVPN